MKYATLFVVSVKHSFYSDGRCPDFEITPSGATQRLLERHRGVVKFWPGGIRVAVAVDREEQPIFAIPASTSFVFDLVLRNDDFALFTDLEPFQELRTPRFVTVGSADELKLVAGSAPISPHIFAQVEIRFSDLSSPPRELDLMFEAKEMHWAYYCITDLGDQIGRLRIRDPAVPGRPLFRVPTRLDEEQDLVASQLAGRYPELGRVRLVSRRPVACRQQPVERFELQLQNERLVGPLPVPSVRSVLRVAEQDALFQVVRYLAEPA